MLNITLDLDICLAKLAAATTIKAGAQVPVTISTFRGATPTSPGASPVFELGLGTDAAPPVLKAYLATFTPENDHTFTGVLDANDTRLVTFMAGKGTVNFGCEVAWTVAGELEVAPSFTVPVQSRIIPADPTSEGGPTFYTQTQVNALLAAITATLTGKQPLDSDLTAIAALTTSAFGRALLALADAAALRTAAGLGTAAILTSDTDTTLAANSDARVATQKAVKAYVAAMVAGLADNKGALDCSADPDYPAASNGDFYRASVAGKVGGGSGKVVEVGDVIMAVADNAGGAEGSVGASWIILQANIAGITAAGLALLQAADADAQTALLTTVIGDSGSGGTKGLVPAPAAGDAAASKFFKADGTWAVPGGGLSLLAAADQGSSGTPQTFLASTWTPFGFANVTTDPGTTLSDPGSLGTMTRFTAPSTGVYLFKLAAIFWRADEADGLTWHATVSFAKNGDVFQNQTQFTGAGKPYAYTTATVAVALTASEYLDFVVNPAVDAYTVIGTPEYISLEIYL